jgi:hypothetical protein
LHRARSASKDRLRVRVRLRARARKRGQGAEGKKQVVRCQKSENIKSRNDFIS